MSKYSHIDVLDMVYLAACAVNGVIPDSKRVETMDQEALFQIAKQHLLTGIIAFALESAGFGSERTTAAKGQAIRKVLLLTAEKDRILEQFEKAGIWYLPLKGSLLKDLYPAIGMRQMSDVDILIDAGRMQDVKTIMRELNYEEFEEGGAHISFRKDPLYNIELHKRLFSPIGQKSLFEYYNSVKDKLLQNKDGGFGYHFSDEDFYIYQVAHEYKHYAHGGTGLRSLLDTYVYCIRKGEILDWNYIQNELGKMNLTEFEEENRILAMKLFEGKDLDSQDKTVLDYILSSGTYGTTDHTVMNAVSRRGKGLKGRIRYFLSRLFLPMDTVREIYPTFAKYPVLLPFLPVYRLIRGLTHNRSRLKAEMRSFFRSWKKQG